MHAKRIPTPQRSASQNVQWLRSGTRTNPRRAWQGGRGTLYSASALSKSKRMHSSSCASPASACAAAEGGGCQHNVPGARGWNGEEGCSGVEVRVWGGHHGVALVESERLLKQPRGAVVVGAQLELELGQQPHRRDVVGVRAQRALQLRLAAEREVALEPLEPFEVVRVRGSHRSVRERPRGARVARRAVETRRLVLHVSASRRRPPARRHLDQRRGIPRTLRDARAARAGRARDDARLRVRAPVVVGRRHRPAVARLGRLDDGARALAERERPPAREEPLRVGARVAIKHLLDTCAVRSARRSRSVRVRQHVLRGGDGGLERASWKASGSRIGICCSVGTFLCVADSAAATLPVQPSTTCVVIIVSRRDGPRALSEPFWLRLPACSTDRERAGRRRVGSGFEKTEIATFVPAGLIAIISPPAICSGALNPTPPGIVRASNCRQRPQLPARPTGQPERLPAAPAAEWLCVPVWLAKTCGKDTSRPQAPANCGAQRRCGGPTEPGTQNVCADLPCRMCSENC